MHRCSLKKVIQVIFYFQLLMCKYSSKHFRIIEALSDLCKNKHIKHCIILKEGNKNNYHTVCGWMDCRWYFFGQVGKDGIAVYSWERMNSTRYPLLKMFWLHAVDVEKKQHKTKDKVKKNPLNSKRSLTLYWSIYQDKISRRIGIHVSRTSHFQSRL